MVRAMLAAVASLRAHQGRMDVIGNNIANVNTTAYKSQRAIFQDMLSQTIRSATRPSTRLGGTNPIQVGLGVQLAAIDSNVSQGSLQLTGKSTDIAIQGNGFFIVTDGSRPYYTRDGSYELDSVGYLVHRATGFRAVGWIADANGAIDQSQPVTPASQITVPLGTLQTSKATDKVDFAGNLDSQVANGETYTFPVRVYDSLGAAHDVTFTWTKYDVNTWDWTAEFDGDASPEGSGQVIFDSNGNVLSGGTGTMTITSAQLGNGAADIVADLDFTLISQRAAETPGTHTMRSTGQNGYPLGALTSFSIAEDGVIEGVFSNGLTRTLAQIALANFANPGGMERVGSNLLRDTTNSGLPQVGAPLSGPNGRLSTGFLEASNVDLGQEFTNMIVTQRGFQANSRIVTTVDEMLQDLINLKR